MQKSSVVTLAVTLSNDRKALCFGGSQSSLPHLQFVQNAAAFLLTGGQKIEHILPFLASFHRLPEHFWVHFQISLFLFKSLNDVSLPCLSELIHSNDLAQSADQLLLETLSSMRKLRVDKTFSAPVKNYDTASRHTSDAVHFKNLSSNPLLGLGFQPSIRLCFCFCVSLF